MKVIRIDDEETKLTKRQKQKVAILKLTDNGKYIEGVGIKDNEFFLITEDDGDEQYLAYFKVLKPYAKQLSTEDLAEVILMVQKHKEITKLKEELNARKESN